MYTVSCGLLNLPDTIKIQHALTNAVYNFLFLFPIEIILLLTGNTAIIIHTVIAATLPISIAICISSERLKDTIGLSSMETVAIELKCQSNMYVLL